LPNDWVKKLKAAHIKSETLRKNFPENHVEEAVNKIGKFIKEKEK